MVHGIITKNKQHFNNNLMFTFFSFRMYVKKMMANPSPANRPVHFTEVAIPKKVLRKIVNNVCYDYKRILPYNNMIT